MRSSRLMCALATLIVLILGGTVAVAFGFSNQHPKHHPKRLKHNRATRGKHAHKGKPVIVKQIPGHGPVLLGDTNVEAMADNNRAGHAQAWPYVASATGTSASISLYVDGKPSASAATVGLYSNSHGQPGALLVSGRFRPVASSWNTVSVPSVRITAGKRYWLAALGTGGVLSFRDAVGRCASRLSRSTTLTALPSAWHTAAKTDLCPAALFVEGIVPTAASPPGPGTVTTSNGTGTTSATGGLGPPPSGSMAHLSPGLPAFSSSGASQCGGFFQYTLNGDTNSLLNNDDYTEKAATCYGFLSTTTFPSWVAYDLSSIPAVQKGSLARLLSTIYDGYNYNYDFAVDNTGDVGTMRNYTIDVACQDPSVGTLPTSGWVTKVTVTGNTLRSRSDIINMVDTGAGNPCHGNYNWIRVNAATGNQWENFQLKWNLWDASQNADDSWMFYGDSVTNVWDPQIQNAYTGEPGTFAQQIHAWNSAYYPSVENGATGGKTAIQYGQYLTTHDGGLYAGGDSTPWLAKTPAHFVVLGLGTNDCNGGEGTSGFQTAMSQLVDEVLSDPTNPNRVVIIPHLQASPNLQSGTNTVDEWSSSASALVPTQVTGNGSGPDCNQAIDQVVTAKQAQYGASRVLAGPDLWAATIGPDMHWGDGLHPYGDAGGIGLYSDAWVHWAETHVYGTLIK